jgi:hypothetical protein
MSFKRLCTYDCYQLINGNSFCLIEYSSTTSIDRSPTIGTTGGVSQPWLETVLAEYMATGQFHHELPFLKLELAHRTRGVTMAILRVGRPRNRLDLRLSQSGFGPARRQQSDEHVDVGAQAVQRGLVVRDYVQ